MKTTDVKLEQILNSKIKYILDQLEETNALIGELEKEKSNLNTFLIVEHNYKKIDFIKELCHILITSNLATTNQIDGLLNTICLLEIKKNEPSFKKTVKPYQEQLLRLEHLIQEEQLHYKKVI
jgi:hypothetical protein